MPTLLEVLGTELLRQVPSFGAERTFDYIETTAEDKDAINRCITDMVERLKRVSTVLADTVMSQREHIVRYAGIAKAVFPEKKPYTYPSEKGTLGVVPIIPQALKYAATPSATNPCYTNYETNRWRISLTAGSAAYLLGNGTDYYSASPTTEKHSFMLILKDGVIEIGTTPKIEQFRLYTKTAAKYGIWATHPLAEIPIEAGKLVYQYSTIGMIPIDHTAEIMFGFMPRESGVAIIKLLGFVFFEHDLLPDLTWRT